MSSADCEEIAAYQQILEPRKILSKRTGRKGQLTKLEREIGAILALSVDHIEWDVLAHRKDELNRQLLFYSALQTRYEELIVDPGAKEEETRSGEEFRIVYQDLLTRADILLRKIDVYEEGIILADQLLNLQELADDPNDRFWSNYATTEKQNMAFRRRSRTYTADPDVEGLRGDTNRLLLNCFKRASDVSSRREKLSTSPTPSYCTPAALPSSSRLTLDLPKFSGNPVDWANFKSLFTSAMKSAGSSLPEPDKCFHLVCAMETEIARQVVEVAGRGENGYENATRRTGDQLRVQWSSIQSTWSPFSICRSSRTPETVSPLCGPLWRGSVMGSAIAMENCLTSSSQPYSCVTSMTNSWTSGLVTSPGKRRSPRSTTS